MMMLWLKTIVDGGYITNILKHLPTGYMVKEIFDQKLLNTLYIPHRKNICSKIMTKITPSCLYGAVSSVATAAISLAPLHL